MKKSQLLLLSCLFGLFISAELSSQTISLSPDNGDPGTSFTVTISGVGTAFSVSSTTTAKISNGTVEYSMTGSAANNTTFNATLDLPSNAPSGSYDGTIYQEGNSGTFWSCSDCFTVNSGCSLSISTNVENVVCQGESNGSIDLTVTGASSPTFAWGNGQTSEDLQNLSAGVYTLSITDGACTLDTLVAVSEPSSLGSGITSTDESTMGANDGTAEVNVDGGVLPYQYAWSNGGSTSSITGLSGGTYTLTVTDANGCTITDEAIINTAMCTLNAFLTSTNVNCNGADDGTVSVNISGGTPGYNVSWSDTSLSTITRNNLSPGIYEVSIVDDGGCMLNDSIIISEPEAITVTVMTTNSTDDTTANGSAQITATGGQGTFMVTIDPQVDSTDVTFTGMLFSTRSSSDTVIQINGLAPGTYDATLIDTAGCLVSSTFVIGSDACALAVSTTTVPNVCTGDSLGVASLSVSGASGTVSILWSNGSTDSMTMNLSAGVYTFNVSDANGCEVIDSVVLEDPEALSANVDSILSIGDSAATIMVTPAGGSGSYQFEWQDSSGIISLDQNLTVNAAGYYTLTLFDDQGCSIVVDSIFVNISSTAILDKEFSHAIKLYPTVSHESINIDINESRQKYPTFLFSNTGQIIEQFELNQGNNQKQVNQLPNGIYFIKVIGESGFAIKKFIKQ